MRNSLLRTVFATALFLAAGSLAQEQVEMTLRVVDAESGKPVTGFRALTFNTAAIAGVADGAPDGQWTGNAEGVAVVRFQAGDTNGYRRRLQVRHPDYVPVEKWWMHYARSATKGPEFPKEFTVKLERGVTIGGVVKNAAGQPLAGVRIFPLRATMNPNSPSPLWPSSYTLDRATNAPHATTDATGRWQFSQFPGDIADAAFAFVRPDQSFIMVHTTEERYSPRSGPVLPLGEFLRRQAEVIMPDGHTVSGRVASTDGKPLAGVVLSETVGRMPGVMARTVTGADGRFTLPHRPAKEIALVAHLPGHAWFATNVLVEPGLPELLLTLRPQQGISGRVVDGDNQPIVSARVGLNQYGQYTPIGWAGTNTDAAGRFRWEAAPFEPTDIYVVITNGPTRKLTLRAGEPERVIIIRREHQEFIRLTGTVVTADTKQPVKEFTVSSSGAETSTFSFKSEGREGRIDMQLPLTAWRAQMLPVGELQVLAEGYAPYPLGRFEFREGDREFHAELRRGSSALAGVILQPDGHPASGAKLELARGSSFTYLNKPGDFQPAGNASERFTTTDDGKYSFPTDQRNKSLVVVHATGFAAAWASNLIGQGTLQLEPWARVTGVAKESGKPLAKESVVLRTASNFLRERFGISYYALTDAEGRFAFEKVPAGQYLMCRRLPTPAARSPHSSIQYSHAQPLTVRVGETKELAYGGQGRTVTGLAQSDPSDLAVNWEWDFNRLVPLRTGTQAAQPNYLDFVSQETYSAAMRRFQAVNNNSGLASELGYQIQFESDGRFRITDVLPGNYELVVKLTEPQPGRQNSFPGDGKPLGAGRRTVEIPAGPLDQLVDVGALTVKISASLPHAKPVPSFEALTLDGQPLRVADLRGRHVALVFWAGWCRASAEAAPDLEKIFTTFQGNPRFAMIGVSLDESSAVARTHADKLGLKWATGWLDEPGRLRLLDTYGVKGTPTIFLLDPSGKISARDLKPASLRAALEKALGTK